MNDVKPIKFNKKQQVAFTTQAHEILYGGARAGGKALVYSERILTTEGWKKICDVHVNDKVFGIDGCPTTVLAETQIMKNHKCYEVTFDNGYKTIVDAGHSWYTETKSEREKKALIKKKQNKIVETGKIRTTEEIFKTLKVAARQWSNHSIPIAKALQYPEKVLPIPPYLLGCWLGDGTKNSGSYATGDEFIVNEIRKLGYDINPVGKKKYAYYIRELITQIRNNKLYNDKHIPALYFVASEKQRLELLQGLMDSDGTVSASGTCEISLSDERLASDVIKLIRGLGIKCSYNRREARFKGKRCKDRFRMKFTTNKPVFRLPRKRKRLQKELNARVKRWFIRDVQEVESQPVKCIQVDAPDSLFLFSDYLIPTHNSFLIRYASILYSLSIPGLQTYLFRRNVKDLKKNHLAGHESFLAILNPFVKKERCKINQTDLRIDFDNGSQIHLCHCQHDKDVEKYRGAEIHFLLIDESTQFTPFQIDFLRTNVRIGGFKIDYKTARKTLPFLTDGFFPRIMYATNPGGISHGYYKSGWMKPENPPMSIFQAPVDEGGMDRIFIPAQITDNYDLMENDPTYRDKLMGLGEDNEVRAMLYGDWDALGGDAFGDIWDSKLHIVEPFPIPKNWYIDRTFDWGSSHPFGTVWWAESDGSTFTYTNSAGEEIAKTYPEGALFAFAEDYGCVEGKANRGLKLTAREVGARIREKEIDLEIKFNIKDRINPGAADGRIFDTQYGYEKKQSIHDNLVMGYESVSSEDYPSGKSIYELFSRELVQYSGSRIKSFELMRTYLKASTIWPPEDPGLYIFSTCRNWISTVPMLSRDPNKVEDVDTKSEDHLYDVTRYRLFTKKKIFSEIKVSGI